MLDRHLARVEMDLDPAQLRSQSSKRLHVVQADNEPRLPFCVEVQVGEPRQTVEEWVAKQQGKHLCACGCGEAIEILPQHHAPSVGIPEFIRGHHKMHMSEFVAEMNAAGLLTVSQAAAELGVSENTLRRHAEGLGVEPVWRSWRNREPMRLYRRDDLPCIRSGLAEIGFRFSADESFTTAEVAEKFGVAENTIRKWERDGLIPKAQRDTNGRRIYRQADFDAIEKALAALERQDQEILDQEKLVTREQAQEMLGIGHRSMQRLISSGDLEPVWKVLASSKRKRQCFRRADVERLR